MKLLMVFIISCFLGGCASTMSYEPTSVYSEGDMRSINDDDIKNAFEAEPQLRLPAKIAWYNMGTDSLPKILMNNSDDIVKENYEIPKTLIDGFNPFGNQTYYGRYEPKPINFKAIRLLAARAKCDIVVLVTSGYHEEKSLNGWAWFSPLILPLFFTPHIDVDYKYAAEIFVFDVRNGYMYGHMNVMKEKEKRKLRFWENTSLSSEINAELMNSSGDLLKNKLLDILNGKKRLKIQR